MERWVGNDARLEREEWKQHRRIRNLVTTASAKDMPSLPDPTSDVTQGLRKIADFGVTLHPDFLTPEMTA